MSDRFNKFDYVEQLEKYIKSECEPDFDKITQYIEEDIDRECIYNATCYEICEELNPSGDFSRWIEELDCSSITAFAFYELREYVFDEININELIEEMKEQAQAEPDICDE